MKAMVLKGTVSLDSVDDPLEVVELPVPEPGAGEVLIKVAACGVCHTELDEIEGRTVPPRYPVVPGHEIVGYVEEVGSGVSKRRVGERVGVGWIHHSDGSEEENVSGGFCATGRDVDGGYAEYMTVCRRITRIRYRVFLGMRKRRRFCVRAIGYRALRLTGLENGQGIGLTGFGGSAHLVLQLVRHLYPESAVLVFARNGRVREFAKELGADWVGATEDVAPQKCHAIIDTTPAWKPVVCALGDLRPGGRLVINAIRKEDRDKEELLRLSYHEHLWMEREIKSVANITGRDIAEFLPVAGEIPIRPEVETYPLAEANRALVELKRKPVRGAKVLVM